jgi:hypothetical protein
MLGIRKIPFIAQEKQSVMEKFTQVNMAHTARTVTKWRQRDDGLVGDEQEKSRVVKLWLMFLMQEPVMTRQKVLQCAGAKDVTNRKLRSIL